MTSPRICWDHAAIQFATQVDVGGLELDDTYADAVFRAVHVSLPVRRVRNASSATPQTSSATEQDVLSDFTQTLNSNEPLLLFITGRKGTGKSHLVRWLKSTVGNPTNWHVVYVEKRNTSLRKVIERILDGIETPTARQLRAQLDEAAAVITTDEEAMDALLARVNHLVKHDPETEIRGLAGATPGDVADLRKQADRLLGDYTFRRVLSDPDGPLARIVHLARGGTDPSEKIDEADLHLREADFRVDPAAFSDTGQEMQRLVGTLVSNVEFRSDLAALCDSYLPRAKAEVFTGQTTSLIDVFQDVRREIASRGQELCLYIEDLVLLHGIDKQLAQALTVPADRELCRLRAAIAVTSGYLKAVDTFTDRGIHFTLDIDVDAVGVDGIRDFVSRYLNAGRLTREQLEARDVSAPTPNACDECPISKQCHDAFGRSPSRYGLFPFNAPSIDRLVALASTDGFQPREVLRQVIRLPLETAQDELLTPGRFPSANFAKSLDESRQNIPVELRAQIRRENPGGSEQEISLRSLYSERPPAIDDSVERIAQFLSVHVSQELGDEVDVVDPGPTPPPGPRPANDEIAKWINEGTFLSAATANKVRRYVCDSVVELMRTGPYGALIRKPRETERKIGDFLLRLNDVEIAQSQGGGGNRGSVTFKIERTDEEALMLRGILAAVDGGGRLDLVDRGQWVPSFNQRIQDFANRIADAAGEDLTDDPSPVLTLALLRNASPTPGDSPATALPSMLRPIAVAESNPVMKAFLDSTRPQREEALQAIRDKATSAKGAGKPSILDVAQLLPSLKTSLRSTHVPDRDADSSLLQQVATKQKQASRSLGTEVGSTLGALSANLDPSEDLAPALVPIDRLVTEAHGHGMLPQAETLTRYQAAKASLDDSALSVYRELSEAYSAGMPPESVWLARRDPIPVLKSLLDYVTVANQVMSHIETRAGESSTRHAETDAGRAISSLTNLADELDDVLKGGV